MKYSTNLHNRHVDSMNSYFSNLISRFGGNDLFSGAYTNIDTAKVPEINYITLFNPLWVQENDESLENLSKQILFFISPGSDDNDDLKKKCEHLNIVGLLRGSCSLAKEFGESSGPVRIQVSGAVIVVVDLEPSFQLACSVATPPDLCERHEIIALQIEKLIQSAHRYFCLVNSTFGKLQEIYGQQQMCEILKEYWNLFMVNFDVAAGAPFGPRLLGWPHRMNYRGFFLLMPHNYRKSCIRIPDSLRDDIDDIVKQFAVSPTGYFVVNFNRTVSKNSGVIYFSDYGNHIEKASMMDLFNLLEFLDYHDELNGDRLGRRYPLSNLFDQLDTASIVSEEDEEPQPLFSLNPAAAIEMLHPMNITNNLVLQPLSTTMSTTVNGIKSLGLVVNQIPWFTEPRTQNEDEENDSNGSVADEGTYIVGARDSTITRFLVHLPTGGEILEYLLVLYIHNGIAQGFLFDSGLEQLSQIPFYEDLKWEVCTQTMGVLDECFQISGGGVGLNTSISSLPNPLKSIIGKAEVLYDDVDRDFFFVIYDTLEHSFQSSLPNLPAFVPRVDGQVVKVAQSLNNAIFHLHDQLADHFIVKSAGRMFTEKSAVNEHLHKFSSNKSNNWLFYAIRHKTKAIVIIRNYNTKNKKTVPPRVESKNVLENVLDYTSLGFLDTLGEDVKVWLEKLGREK